MTGKIVAGVIVAFCLSVFIPGTYEYSVEIEIKAPPEKVWKTIMDYTTAPQWSPNLEKVLITTEKDGVQLTWEEVYTDMVLQYTLDHFSGYSITANYGDKAGLFKGHLVMAALNNKNGTTAVIRDKGTLLSWWFLALRPADAKSREYLDALKKYVEEGVTK